MPLVIWFLVIPITIALSSMWRGFVLTKLWAWFAVPTFGIVELTLPVAIGIALIASYLTYQHKSSNTNDSQGSRAIGEAAIVTVIHPAVTLLIGWIVSLFM